MRVPNSAVPRFKSRTLRRSGLIAAAVVGGAIALSTARAENTLVTGKHVVLSPLSQVQNVGSLPMNMIATTDGKYAITSDMGFRQSLWSIRTSDGAGVSHIDFNNDTPTTSANGLYYGLAIAADGTLYAAQGANDSIAVVKVAADGTLTQTGTIAATAGDFPSGLSLDTRGNLYVANNDGGKPNVPGSVAIYNTASGKEVGRYRFADSFGGTPNYPLAVAALADGHKVYVSSQRDGLVYVINATDPTKPTVANQLATGSHPISLLLSKDQSRLFVANAQSDTVSIVSTADDKTMGTVLLRPTSLPGIAGATPTGLGLSPDEKLLFVTLGDMNAVAVVGADDFLLKGYLPTGWYPTGVVAQRRNQILVANAKGAQYRYPNPTYKFGSFAGAYGLNLIEGDVTSFVFPNKLERLADYTQFVLDMNRITDQTAYPTNPLSGINLKAGKIQHVIYIVKENRTYDQVLGDLPAGNGDSTLTLFGKDVTPNQHALASRFVLLDNFYDSGEASGDGWPWSTQAMANESVIKNLPYNYSGRGRNYDFEGQNNGYLTGGFPGKDPDGKALSDDFANGLPPIPDVSEAPAGHIWDLVKMAGLSYRDYGFFYSFGVSTTNPDKTTHVILPDNYPAAAGLQPGDHDLKGQSDIDYRRYDNDFPDSDAPSLVFAQTQNKSSLYSRTMYGKYNMPSRFSEWSREFQAMLTKDPTGASVPNFMMVRFHHDHTQGFAPGKHSPRSEVADNDFAVGQLVQTISNSPIWKNTAIFVLEDDSQDGPDHVDSHRSICFAISPWIKASSVDHTFYNTPSVLKTIESLLGLPPMNQYDAVADPIMDWDTAANNATPFTAIMPDAAIISEQTPAKAMIYEGSPLYDLATQSEKMNFDLPDSAPAAQLNEVLWKGIKGPNVKMPAPRHGTVDFVSMKTEKKRRDAMAKAIEKRTGKRIATQTDPND